jgi:hypothetical protein
LAIGRSLVEEKTMIAVAFIMFAVLVLAWLIAPNGDVKVEAPKVPAPTPALKLGEAGV